MALFPVHRANRLIKIVIAVHNQLNSLTTLSAHTAGINFATVAI